MQACLGADLIIAASDAMMLIGGLYGAGLLAALESATVIAFEILADV